MKCYHKKFRSATRDVIFRLQFHTGAVQGYGLLFGKEELDSACKGEWVKPVGMSEASVLPCLPSHLVVELTANISKTEFIYG